MVTANTYKTFGDQTKPDEEKKEVEGFDELLEMVGEYGPYQKRFLYAVISPILFFISLNTNTSIFYLAVPDHWCHVSELDRISSPTWKNLSIPMVIGPDGSKQFSQCLMFVSENNHTQIPCIDGWDYDHVDYSSTIPSTYNWVCNKSMYATALLSSSPFGTLCGTVFFGIGGDRFGRKRTLFVCLTTFAILRALGFLLARNLLVFLFISFLTGMVVDPVKLLLILIAAEVTGKEKRSWIYGARYIVSTCGDAILPGVVWMTGGSWISLVSIVTPPLFALLFLYPFVPESPRWLLSKGRFDETGEVIRRIARANGTLQQVQRINLDRVLEKSKTKHDDRYKRNGKGSPWHLFMHKGFAINTALLSICQAIYGTIAYGISISIVGLSGNPFVNYFICSIDTLPSGWIGNWLVGKTGRRWTHVVFLLLTGIGYAVAIIAIEHNVPWFIITTMVITGYLMSMGMMILPLQAVEVFPTELRSTGCGVISFFGGLGTGLAPSIVALGEADATLPYFIFFCISIFGSIAVSFLPETLNQSLPETVEDANELGRNAKYWSFLPNPSKPVEKQADEIFSIDEN